MIEDRVSTTLAISRAIAGAQSVVGVFRGNLKSVSRDRIIVTLDPYARADLLKVLYGDDPQKFQAYKKSISISLFFFASASGGTEVVLTTQPSIHYMVNALKITAITHDSFARTVQQTFVAMQQNRRPPDSPAPPR